jgi:hypothetical protein
MVTAPKTEGMQTQLPMETTTVTIAQRFDPGMFLLNRSVQNNHPVLAQLVTWRNSVDLFREQEKRDFRDLYHDIDHRSVLSALIGQGEVLLCHAKMQSLALEGVGLSFEMVESEIRALRDDLRITHEELISEEEARNILGIFPNA